MSDTTNVSITVRSKDFDRLLDAEFKIDVDDAEASPERLRALQKEALRNATCTDYIAKRTDSSELVDLESDRVDYANWDDLEQSSAHPPCQAVARRRVKPDRRFLDKKVSCNRIHLIDRQSQIPMVQGESTKDHG